MPKLNNVHIFPSLNALMANQDAVTENDMVFIPADEFTYSRGEIDEFVESMKAYVVETYVSPEDGKSWYRRWSDGWLEQGIIYAGTWSSATYRQINLLQPYRDTNYNVQINYVNSTSDGTSARALSANSKNEYFFTNYISNGIKSFYICGYGKEEENEAE